MRLRSIKPPKFFKHVDKKKSEKYNTEVVTSDTQNQIETCEIRL